MSSPTSGEEGESNCNYEMPSITVEDKTNETMTGETTTTTTTTTVQNEDVCQQQQQQQQQQQPISSPHGIIPPNSEPQIDYGGLALVFLAPALGGFLYGYDIGATSFVLSMMLADRDHDNWWHKFPKIQQGLFISSLAFGALIGSHIVLTFLVNSIGRRKEIRIAATLYIVGAMLNVMSGTILATTSVFQWPPKWYAKNGDGSDEYYSYEYTSLGFGWGFTLLLMGRMFYGAGVGFIMHGAPTYMAEMSPSNVRGALVSAKETVIVFGIVVGMLMGDLQSDYPANWTDLYGYSILFAVPMLILTFKIPRSQRWLLLKGYHEEAKESMQFVYKGNVEDEFEKMADSINNICCRGTRNVSKKKNGATFDYDYDIDDMEDSDSVISGGTSNSNSIIKSSNRRATIGADGESIDDDDVPGSMCSKQYRNIMVIGMGLLLAQQFSGQPCVLAYSRVLFEAAGWGGHTSIITVTIMGVVSSFTVSMVDRLGRKTLLAAGSTIMLISVSCLSYGFWGWDENSNATLSDTKKQIVLWSMLVFISGFQIGFGPISWTVLSEIYPTEIRGSAMALSVEVNFFAKFLTQFLFPVVQGMIGWGTTFVAFACIILLGLIFIIFKVPETKGMTLEEIQLKLQGDGSSEKRNSRIRKINTNTSSDSDFQYCNMDSISKASVVLKDAKSQSDLAPIV